MSRIINRQRQLAEQGRLRLGYTVPGEKGPRPVRSETWIVTSHNRDHVARAAELWGGDVHEWEPMGNGAKQWRVITQAKAIPAILPPGDPLTQAYEQWNRGGCVRRCDGATESFSGSPCICLAQHGETWFELSSRQVCSSKSRLKVLLPDMEGLGAWRMETGSYYATDEIAGMVDTIRGAVGDSILVPVWLRIEPRTRVAGGETKHFVVPILDLRGVSAGALLSGDAQKQGSLILNDPTKTPRELEAAASADPYTPFFDSLPSVTSYEDLVAMWNAARDQHLVGTQAPASPRAEEFVEAWKARARELKAAEGSANEGGAPAGSGQPEPDAEGIVDAELVDEDPDVVWQEVVLAAGQRDMTSADLEQDFAQRTGVSSSEASAGEMRRYLQLLAQEPAA